MQALNITVDKTGFPLVDAADLPFAILWLPVTKIQFEHFLVDTELYDSDWYQKNIQANGRISPGSANTSNYWQLFITDILPQAAQQYADWCGPGFNLPTSQQWKTALHYFAQSPDSPDFLNTLCTRPIVNERARAIAKIFDNLTAQDVWQLSRSRYMCDQMGMRLGLMEVVYENEQRNSFCAWGQPNKRLYATANNPLVDAMPMQFIDRTRGVNMKYGGFRLIRSK